MSVEPKAAREGKALTCESDKLAGCYQREGGWCWGNCRSNAKARMTGPRLFTKIRDLDASG